jgi:protocatechuate 3,4-dioxygenase beta subunit
MNQAPSGTHAAMRIHNASIEANDVQNVHIRNNIFETEGSTQLVQVTSTQLDGAVDLKFQGNVYFAHSGGFKIVWGSTTLTTIAAFRGKSQETLNGGNVGFSGDPLLNGAGTGGTVGADNLGSLSAYKVQAVSPVINKGLNLPTLFGLSVGSHDFFNRTMPQGAGFEIGVYEADASAPGGDPPPEPTGGSISGTVFNDANGNGVKDSGEAGIGGITVYNDANNNSAKDTGELTATTDGSGAYTFSNLAATSYKIRQILQSGWTQTAPAGGVGWSVTLGTNQVITGKDFGTKNGGGGGGGGGSIAGKVWNDIDGDGVLDSGEVGVAGITVYNDANNNSAKDTGELATTTDGSGNYTFSSLAAGNYKIRQILQSGWSQTSPAGGFGWTIALATNQILTAKNFGTKNSGGGGGTGGSIAGRVFNDLNNNGVQDAGENGISGITIYNDANNNNAKDAGELVTTTGANGDYLFGSLAAGSYKIRQILQAGWIQTTPANGFGWTITLATNQNLTAKNFGTKL